MSQNFFIFILTLAIALVGFSLYKTLTKKTEINDKIAGLKLNVEELRDINNELSAALDYLKTDSYIEKEAKKNLNLQKFGEKVIIINRRSGLVSQEKDSQEDLMVASEEKEYPNWILWRDYFFYGE